MKPLRLFCIILAFSVLFGCGSPNARPAAEDKPPVHVTYTPDPTAAPSELIEAVTEASSASGEPHSAGRLYGNDWITLYRGYRDGSPGLCVETKDWSFANTRYLELPGTEEQTELTIPKIEVRPEGQRGGVYVRVYYVDDAGQERILCFDRNDENYTLAYPLSTEPGLELTPEQQQNFDDLLLMGYLYKRIQGEKNRLLDPESWESLCQLRILDALYYNYNDALPPYLIGEGEYGSDQYATIVSLAELESFFQSTLGRPCLAQIEFNAEDRKNYPDLPEDQIILFPTDYFYTPYVKQAVWESDGTITLYGCQRFRDAVLRRYLPHTARKWISGRPGGERGGIPGPAPGKKGGSGYPNARPSQ